MPRQIDDVLLFRTDISPFLAHLTKTAGDTSAENVLRVILDSGQLLAGGSEVSDIKYGGNNLQMSAEQRKSFFGAVCLTETPLSEVYCLLDLASRRINLEPYGLLFVKEKIRNKGASPVYYLNNYPEDKYTIAQALFSLTATHEAAAKEILPLFSVTGPFLAPPGQIRQGKQEFSWEREWRYPASKGPLAFEQNDVFIGLCPADRIAAMERAYPWLKFVDPRLNQKLYAQKLIQSRDRIGLKNSVV
ncbi:hypothetical protein FHY13_001998 [Xanthomonas arboricola]|uniref:hypothetical protein n=1 Tax=Xanthomonas euroxanthea TaxID=2259622 RepID=UPI0016071C59|nr:hypothetical protein [Xanthomonas euroxanthea]MBB3813651.1 hypothetical protein [Xanthomonas euroxanthea]